MKKRITTQHITERITEREVTDEVSENELYPDGGEESEGIECESSYLYRPAHLLIPRCRQVVLAATAAEYAVQIVVGMNSACMKSRLAVANACASQFTLV